MHWRNLPEALGLTGREIVSFVGGGGKTTGLFALAAARPGGTVITTTTKMGRDRTGGLPVLVDPADEEVAEAVARAGSVIVWGGVDDHRATGVSIEACARYLEFVDTVAVEADGSRRRPFKAPLDYEPVVPPATSVLVACCGMAAIGAPIDVGCHRPERVAAIVDASVDEKLTPARLVQVLLSSQGSAKDRPPAARFAVVLNRVRPEQSGVVAEIRERIAAQAPEVPVVALDELAADQLPDHVA
ncbi:MAG: selenium cofactor biosynthesis protein YqeC [Actinomycetota bacterium]